MSNDAAVSVTKTEPALPARNEPTFADQMALASTLLKTGFLPKGLDTPGKVLAVILTGREMGLGPMTSTRSIGVINGKPVVAADLQLALFKRAGGQAKWLLTTEEEAKLWLKHPNGDEYTSAFSMKDAETAGLLSRADTYRKFPKAMLRARAITAGLKAIGFEATAGVYDPQELSPLLEVNGPPPEEQPLDEKPRALAAKEPMPWDGEPETSGEVASEADTQAVFREAFKSGIRKDSFSQWYEETVKRPFRGVMVEDVPVLLKAAAERLALKAKVSEASK